MKTRISKILGVMLSVTLVASMFLFAAPVTAAPGENNWFAESMPVGGRFHFNGSTVRDIAVANATTLFIANGTGAGATAIYRSTNTGQSFSAISVAGSPVGNPIAVAVAPDNPDAIACTDGADVYVSNDAGTTWSTLPRPAGVTPLPIFFASIFITDIAVGPARSGTLLGREYAVSIADAGALTAAGDVRIIGNTAAWIAGPAGVIGAADFTSVVFTPNFLGDRCLVAVGTLPGGVGAATTRLFIINTQTNALVVAGGTPLVPDGS